MTASSDSLSQVSILLVTWNSAATLPRCLESLSRQTCTDFELIVVDNGSTDGCTDGLEQAWLRLPLHVERLSQNTGYAAASNLAARLARSRWLAMLNPDAFPQPNWLEALLQAAAKAPDYSFFASRQLQAEAPNLLDGAGDVLHTSGLAWRRLAGYPAADFGLESVEVFGPCGAAALYSRQAFADSGGFDEDFFGYHEDVDLAFRLRLAGLRCLYVPEAVVHHVGSASLGADSDFALYHWQRNYVWAFAKDMPNGLLWRTLPAHLAANVVHLFNFILRGRGRVVFRAKVDALRGLTSVLRKRRVLQRECVVRPSQINSVLERGALKPYLLGYRLRRFNRIEAQREKKE
jgi:GT2 family glycosyltransferase